MSFVFPNSQSIPLGVVIRKSPGVTRWAKWAWRVVDMVPGAGSTDWTVLRQQGQVTDYLAATVPLQLYPSDTEAYVHELQARSPSIYVVLNPDPARPETPWTVSLATASPYEAQDYCDSDEALVEKLPMPDGMRAWIADFVGKHHVEETFVKRKRKNMKVDGAEDGIGDPRIAQDSDVYRAPRHRREAS
ncbi:hypothetical protein GCM10016455_28690 [Aliiroseovarius zhejiangensis]|uniref:DUF3305 domain-containing protein n=1 Tax=Aliiroseovarius zhejiangensis TaxID=1632025 RepID=A0ABQ3J6F3_9RHOB|nr:DUF3305 domain-containing protein [Aliiroseovarius zhejiangensis]GHF05821.1 hypothetical protein GCM10016455_28690 [Aliiroseovarius zhejiangensis]